MYWLIIPVLFYSLLILFLWLKLVSRKDAVSHNTDQKPRVTVVIACRDEEKHIERLLESLMRQDYQPDLLEILIVNDNSADRTPLIISEFIEKHREASLINTRLIFNPFPGKKGAVRYGIRKSSGDLIITTDADCVVSKGWVSAHASQHSATGAYMILGEVYQEAAGSFASHFSRLEFSALQAITEACVLIGHPVMCNAANMSFTREVYIRHQSEVHHEIASGDDMFLMHAVRRGGGRLGYVVGSEAAVVTASAVTAAALLRQRARWASKAFHFRDPATVTLAAATAACNAAVTAAALLACISVKFLALPALLYALRFIPDLAITRHKIKARKEQFPLLPFLISELIYPFYFVTVAFLSLLPASRTFKSRNR